jgi:hypothetical protein
MDRLHYRLEPTERIFSKNEATACLKSKIKWIHVDGDSISRDILYDITELFGMGWNEKKKTLEDMEFDVGIHATFSGNTIEFSPQPNWVKSTSQIEKDQPQDCPDLWIYASLGPVSHQFCYSYYRFPKIFTINFAPSVLPKRLNLYIAIAHRHLQTTPTIAACLTKFSGTLHHIRSLWEI